MPDETVVEDLYGGDGDDGDGGGDDGGGDGDDGDGVDHLVLDDHFLPLKKSLMGQLWTPLDIDKSYIGHKEGHSKCGLWW